VLFNRIEQFASIVLRPNWYGQ